MQAAREVFHNPSAQPRSMMRPLLAGLLASIALAVVMYQPIEKATERTKTEAKTKVANKTEAAKPKAAMPVTLEWPPAEPRSHSKAMAYAALFRAWGAEYKGEDECIQAKAIGLRCRITRGGLDELRQLNRPAVLLMNDHQGKEFYATLTRLDDQSATFTIGTETRVVALGTLAEQWSGDYTLLWRMPPVARHQIRLGDSGTDVEWVSNQLAKIHGKAAGNTKNQVFDEAMMRQVRQFQLVHGLPPVGTVGPQTMMRLSGAADMTAPKLSREQREK
jgi:general secretion pathway protein A